MNLQVLTGKVALVTGASRGIGRGIAHVLVENGVTVYITGREHKESNDYKNVMETAAELNKLGCGKCIGVFCDHKNDEDTKKVFDQIKKNEDKLDILVNNAFSMLDLKDELSEKMFWKKDASLMWDKTINVGLRSNYIASCMALELMMPKKKG
ncbi:Dehydrogenase/reductase SDR family member 1 [Thelohanellus kitauei]|uniref:Dehydrogenase/reductase SDR family member 1 n=1 Tax=Thelohanellus kitauei TaxID=669202 RepID=A0A0C2IZX6_THEKT|nr:Dehydrogenase/reductase SDR family member 1 [Thelohanellus kitauei]